MKLILAALMAIGTAAATFAQETPAEPIKISDTEAVVIEQTIRGFVEVKKDRVELFDRKKGKTVALRLDRIVTDDPECVKFPQEGLVAICGECTEVMTDGEKTMDGDKYVVWFVVQRGTLPLASVKDVVIKSVNGNPMYTWTKSENGTWQATVVPDAPAAP
jgi:hypothetical protein